MVVSINKGNPIWTPKNYSRYNGPTPKCEKLQVHPAKMILVFSFQSERFSMKRSRRQATQGLGFTDLRVLDLGHQGSPAHFLPEPLSSHFGCAT